MNAHSEIVAAPPMVYSAISAVMAEMAKEGISKDRKNEQQGYKFRGIDDVYNSLSSVLAKHKLVMLPFVQDMIREERQTAKGGTLIYTILTVDFTMACGEDGSTCIARMKGEAMDSGDKSCNKAQSAALKYAALQVFMIPTEGDNDADAATHEVVATKTTRRVTADDIEPAGGWGDWARDLIATVHQAKDEAALDALKSEPANKARINAIKAYDKMMCDDIGKAFKARRAVVSDEVPF